MRKSKFDLRNELYRDFLELVEFLRPAYVLIEEVPQFLSDEIVNSRAVRQRLYDHGIKNCFRIGNSLGRGNGCHQKHNKEGICDDCLKAVVVEALEREERPNSTHGSAQDDSEDDRLPSQQRLTQGPQRQSSSEFNRNNVLRNAMGSATAVRCIEKRADGDSASAVKPFAKLWLRVWDEANGNAETESASRLPRIKPGMETIKALEAFGFEVTVGVGNLTRYGLPQRRVRACVFGAAPGWGRVRLPPVTHEASDEKIGSWRQGVFKQCIVKPPVHSLSRSASPRRQLEDGTTDKSPWRCKACATENYWQISSCEQCNLTYQGDAFTELYPTQTIRDALRGLPEQAPVVGSKRGANVNLFRKVRTTRGCEVLNHVALETTDRGSKIAIEYAEPGEQLSVTYERVADMLDQPSRDAFEKLVRNTRRQASNYRSPWGEASRTLTCKLNREGEAQYWHPEQPRLYTARETLRCDPEIFKPALLHPLSTYS
jgi:site-specific DNA-cytosine methylase